MIKSALTAGAPPWTPLRELTAVLRPPSWTNGGGGKMKGEDGTAEEGRESGKVRKGRGG